MGKTSQNRTGQKQPGGGKSYLPFIIIGVVLVAAIALAVSMLRSDKPASGSTSNLNTTQNSVANANANANLGTSRSAPTVRNMAGGAPGAQPPHAHGDANAPVTLEEFGDYECPPCGMFHGELKKLEAQYGSRLRVVFRNLPLTMHKYAQDAARAAEAAALQGKFWEMNEMLYKQQSVWKDEANVRARFATYAQTLGLDVERFKRDMDSPQVTQRIMADMQRADSLGAKGTPTIFVNGREIGGDSMQEIIQNVQSSVASAMTGNTR